MRSKFASLMIVLILAFSLTGCSLFSGGDSDEDTTDIVTPTIPLEEDEDIEEDLTPTLEEEELTPTPTEDRGMEDAINPIITMDPVEGKVTISEVSVIYDDTVPEVTGSLRFEVVGAITDNCTIPRYTWSIEGSTVMVDLGVKDENIETCESSNVPYSSEIEINYAFDEDIEYVVDVNGMQSLTFVYVAE